MLPIAIALALTGVQFKATSEAPQVLINSVRYVPFEFETYLPVTKDNISSQGTEVAQRLRTKESLLLRILTSQGKPAKIDPKRIRLRVITAEGEVIHMDATFAVMRGSRQFRLTDRNRDLIDAMFYRDWMRTGPTPRGRSLHR
jgi:hypothetical protein